MAENLPISEQLLEPRHNRLRWVPIAVWAGVFFLLAIVAISLLSNRQGPLKIGSPAPDFSLTTFNKEIIHLSELQGKVIVINFWASWCKTCEQEAADLEEAWRFYQPRGDVVFLGINHLDTEPEAMAYLQKYAVTYPNGPDLATRISPKYRITGVPETFIIAKDGTLAYAKFSPFLSLAEIKAAIDPLLEP